MEKNLSRNRLEFSEPLSYKFGQPLRDYSIDKFIDPKSRLFIDAVDDIAEKIKEVRKEGKGRRVPITKDAYNSLNAFRDVMEHFHRWRPRYFYDIDWEKLGLDKYMQLDGGVVPDEVGWLDHSEELGGYHYPELYIKDPDFFDYERLVNEGYILNFTCKHNIHSILDLLKSYNRNETQSTIAAIYISVERFDDAIRVYEDKGEKGLHDYYNLGNIYLLEKKDYAKARECFLGAIELKEARYNMGMTYLYESNWEEALEQFSFLAKPCPIGGGIGNEMEKLTDLISSEKLYISDLVRVLPNDFLKIEDYSYSCSYSDDDLIPLDPDLKDTISEDADSNSYSPKESNSSYRNADRKTLWFNLIVWEFHEQKSRRSQIIQLEFALIQMSCNNIGVCSYYIDSNVIRALDWFETALSWEEVTGLKIGRKNIRCLVESPISIDDLHQQEKDIETIENMIGSSEVMKSLYRKINQWAKTESDVLITGESGTGKEMVANAIHNRSKRKDNKCLAINCAALPETLLESELFGHERGAFTGANNRKRGIFELADGGTVFLDEIGEMSLQNQVKLLRVLQERKFMRVGGEEIITTNVRIISATNKDLLEEIRKEKFRVELYYRINVCQIQTPPLHDRKEDIPALVAHFIKKATKKNQKIVSGISKDVISLLEDCDWPGNVRELENVIETLVVNASGKTIQLKDITEELKNEVFKELKVTSNKERILLLSS